MSTDYDAIADRYQKAKRQAWRTHVEAFTLAELLGDVRGRSAVDIACGEGFSTRLLRDRGADPVVGVDRSEAMIALARDQERGQPRPIDYRVGDARTLGLARPVELATAAYLLNYADTAEVLGAMAAGVARCLAPGGRFVALNAHPDLPFERGEDYLPYGFEVRATGPKRPGMAYTWRFLLDDGPVEVENYWLPRSTYEEALHAAGFREIRWHQPRVAPAGVEALGAESWRTLLEHPPIVALECRL